MARRAGRRHDRLGRRERPPARGRGGARRASRRGGGRGDRRAWTSGSASASSRSSSGPRRAEELDAHCLGSSLARFKRPREYRRTDALPKSASGKILRRLLRDEESHVTEHDGFTVERDGRGRDDHARRPRQAQPRLDGRARPALGGLRRARRATTRCGSSSSREPAARSPRAATSPASSSAPRGGLAARPQRRRARALLEARHRARSRDTSSASGSSSPSRATSGSRPTTSSSASRR